MDAPLDVKKVLGGFVVDRLGFFAAVLGALMCLATFFTAVRRGLVHVCQWRWWW